MIEIMSQLFIILWKLIKWDPYVKFRVIIFSRKITYQSLRTYRFKVKFYFAFFAVTGLVNFISATLPIQNIVCSKSWENYKRSYAKFLKSDQARPNFINKCPKSPQIYPCSCLSVNAWNELKFIYKFPYLYFVLFAGKTICP